MPIFRTPIAKTYFINKFESKFIEKMSKCNAIQQNVYITSILSQCVVVTEQNKSQDKDTLSSTMYLLITAKHKGEKTKPVKRKQQKKTGDD